MSFQDHLLLWNHATLKVLDVRFAVMQPGDSLRAYQLPANVFLYTACGKAQVVLDELEYAADKCFVCHAGKGTFLDIVHVTEALDYYMIYYSATMTLPCRQELLLLHKENSPFQLQYGFSPQYPVPLFLKIEHMLREWQYGGTLHRFHVKAQFHQFVYELLKQLQSQGGTATKPDVAAQAIRYIDERYAEPITLHSLAELYPCNVRQLQRLFKARLQTGPMEYLMKVRMQKAQMMLRQTDAPLQQIAESVGYMDGYYFSRMFKKYVGVSPLLFKEKARSADPRRSNPSPLSQSPIGARRLRQYSRIDDENHYQYKYGGVSPMYKNNKTISTVGLMLSLLLMLTACSTAPASQAGPGSGGAGQVSSQSASSVVDSKQMTKPVTIKHLKGELTLERRPEKIAVLDAQYIDQLLALTNSLLEA